MFIVIRVLVSVWHQPHMSCRVIILLHPAQYELGTFFLSIVLRGRGGTEVLGRAWDWLTFDIR